MKIIGITQARIGSTRLPGKVLMAIQGKTLLEYHLERATNSKFVNSWIVATTKEIESKRICEISSKLKIQHYQGSTEDVLSRFYLASKEQNPDYVVRITSDCPLIDPELIDQVIEYAISNELNYAATSPNYPDGVDTEVFKFEDLKEAYENAVLKSDREHVTPYIKRKYQVSFFPCLSDFSNVRFTVDESADFQAIETLISSLGANEKWQVYADYIINNPLIFKNQNIIRNEGYIRSLKKDSNGE